MGIFDTSGPQLMPPTITTTYLGGPDPHGVLHDPASLPPQMDETEESQLPGELLVQSVKRVPR